MNKLKFILAAALPLSLALTTSCSDGGDEGSSGGSGPITETYTLKGYTDSEFTYVEVDVEDYCAEGGVLESKESTYNNTVDYSIDNKVLTWQNHYSSDTLNFKGTTDNLIGTWTRTKDKAKSCEIKEYKNEYSCKQGYDITKAVFTNSTVEITTDRCRTDWVVDGSIDDGWRIKIIDCNAAEYSKGSDKITYRRTETSEEISYKGKTCTYSEPSEAKKKAACKKSWDDYRDNDHYWDILEEDFDKCLSTLNLPADFI